MHDSILKTGFLTTLLGSVGLFAAWGLPCSSAAPYKLPQAYHHIKDASASADKLETLIIAINGKPQMVEAGQAVSFLRGDLLVIKDAFLRGRKKTIEKIEVLGYGQAGKPLKGQDHRGVAIDTSKELVDSERAIDRDKGAFAILATSHNTLHGMVLLQPVDPQLQYLEVLINGQNRAVRAGESLVVTANDTFKVSRVASNVADTANVHFTIVPMHEVPMELRSSHYAATYHSILLSHRDYVFASIPLRIEQR